MKNHTLESSSAQENSPLIIKLIVSEIFVAAPKGIGCIALSVLSQEYEPSILLQGEWVRAMGFEKGQHIQVVAMSNLLAVEHVDETVKQSDKLDFEHDRCALFKNFKDELDVMKAGYTAINKGEEGGLNGVVHGGQQGSKKGSEGAFSNGSKVGSKSVRKNGRKSEDNSEELAEVSCD